MKDIVYRFVKECRQMRGGAISSRVERTRKAGAIARDIAAAFPGLHAENIGRKHVAWYVGALRCGGLSKNGNVPTPGTMKNYLSVLRAVLRRLGKPNLLPNENDALGIPRRSYVRRESIALVITGEQVAAVERHSPYFAASLLLMQAFGLRHEESMKVVPALADHVTELRMQGSWCKNGKPRSILIRTAQQREALSRAHAVAREGSLIPASMTYIAAKKQFQAITGGFGITHRHGLRHKYAELRYIDLTGNQPPVLSGLSVGDVSSEYVLLDRAARDTITFELGHKRRSVVGAYLGSLYRGKAERSGRTESTDGS